MHKNAYGKKPHHFREKTPLIPRSSSPPRVPHVDVRRVEPLYTDTALVLGLAGSLMDINEEQPVRTKARKAQDEAGRHSSIDVNEEQPRRRRSRRCARQAGARAARYLTTMRSRRICACTSSVRSQRKRRAHRSSNTVCTTPFDFPPFSSVHASPSRRCVTG